MDLTHLSPTEAHVGYGQLGLGGELGYEGRRVRVGGLTHPRAISAHAPSNVIFLLDGRFAALAMASRASGRRRVAFEKTIGAGLAVIENRRRADGPPPPQEGP